MFKRGQGIRALALLLAVLAYLGLGYTDNFAELPGEKTKSPGVRVAADGPPYAPDKHDSYRYYGPNGLDKTWTAGQRRGRDTWIHWTGGNQKFLRYAATLGSKLPAPVSIEMLRLLDSRQRDRRFTLYGLINEPNCEPANARDPETGLWLDVWKGDGYKRGDGYPYGDAHYDKGDYPYYPDPKIQEYARYYGEPTGVVGLRKFHNPRFWDDPEAQKRWKGKEKDGKPDFQGMQDYFRSPGSVEPPYLVGFSCAFCHMSFNPTNPPKDPNHPRWDNLAANMGNQYFREGELFLGRGRIIFGDRNPGPNQATDPYDTRGLTTANFLYHYATTQQPGTSETSRISYDFINNPNTINPIFNLGNRPLFPERSPDGELRLVNHVLKDGADSVGIEPALLRVWINIFCEGQYWSDTLYNPVTGHHQTPLDLEDLRLPVRDEAVLTPAQKARKAALKKKYGDDVGQDWEEAHRRNPYLLSYLASYTPYHLENFPAGRDILKAETASVENGRKVFAEKCAECHSNKQPPYPIATPGDRAAFYRDSVNNADFRVANTLSDDRRYSGNLLGTNLARALATNAIDGDVWAQLSSVDYKSLPPLGRLQFRYQWVNAQLTAKPLGQEDNPSDVVVDFVAPGGGRGYYRTPSLVSLWATAPYLHNNSLGDYYVIDGKGKKFMFPNDGRELLDDSGAILTIDTSLEGRLKMFEDGMTRMLWPKNRRSYIKKTATDSNLIDLVPFVRQALPRAIAGVLIEFVEAEVACRVDAYIQDIGLKGTAAENLRQAVLVKARAQLAELREKLESGEVQEVKDKLVTLIKGRLEEEVVSAAGQQHAAALKEKLKAVVTALEAEATRLKQANFLNVPKGTPVNLYMNLPASAIPYALIAQIKYHNDPRKLTEALLGLSNCPDLVEDRGHTFGSELTDQQKKDLIAYLKTL